MAVLDPTNVFQSYLLTEEELKIGHILNTNQVQAFQNYLAQLANERINLTFTPENVQRDAALQGAIGTMRYLLELSLTYQRELAQEASLNSQLP